MTLREMEGQLPIAAILRDTYRVPLSPLSATSPPWQICVDECFGLFSSSENHAYAIGGHWPTLRYRSANPNLDYFRLAHPPRSVGYPLSWLTPCPFRKPNEASGFSLRCRFAAAV
jgi:hypothetical protein